MHDAAERRTIVGQKQMPHTEHLKSILKKNDETTNTDYHTAPHEGHLMLTTHHKSSLSSG